MTKVDNKEEISSLFGDIGNPESSSMNLSDANIKNHSSYTEWLYWAESKYKGEFQPDRITDSFTSIRRQTKLKNGIAEEHSLRSVRVLNKGLKFSGTISKNDGFTKKEKALLTLAFSNLRAFGVNRNRGFGKIVCELADGENNTIDLNTSYKEVIS